MTRRIYDPFKKASEQVDAAQEAASAEAKAQVTVDVDLKDLLGKTRTILQREIQNLMSESSGGLLSKESSSALVNYIKLLKDLIKDENTLLDSMSDEELQQLLKPNT